MQILVADDHAFVREGIKVFLERQGHVVQPAGDVDSALAVARQVPLDAAVLDLIIPVTTGVLGPIVAENGIRLGQLLTDLHPRMGIVFLSSYMQFQADVFSLLRRWRGGVYYKSKMAPPEELLDALEHAVQGKTHIDPTVLTDPRPLVDELRATLTAVERPLVDEACLRLRQGALSAREVSLARSVASARSIAGAARELSLSPNTITTLMTRLYDKLGLSAITRDREADLRADVLLAKAILLYDVTQPRQPTDSDRP